MSFPTKSAGRSFCSHISTQIGCSARRFILDIASDRKVDKTSNFPPALLCHLILRADSFTGFC